MNGLGIDKVQLIFPSDAVKLRSGFNLREGWSNRPRCMEHEELGLYPVERQYFSEVKLGSGNLTMVLHNETLGPRLDTMFNPTTCLHEFQLTTDMKKVRDIMQDVIYKAGIDADILEGRCKRIDVTKDRILSEKADNYVPALASFLSFRRQSTKLEYDNGCTLGNQSKQLGLGNTTSYSSPKQVGSLTNWSKVSNSNISGLAVKTEEYKAEFEKKQSMTVVSDYTDTIVIPIQVLQIGINETVYEMYPELKDTLGTTDETIKAVEKASSVADSFVDKQYGLSSFTRDPLRINPGMVPTIGIVAGTLIGGPVGTAVAVGTGATGGFLSRGVRNLLNRIFKTDRAWFTIKKDDVTALVTGFLQGYAGVQHSAFMSNIKEAFSLNSRLSFKDRAIKLNSAVFEQLIPIIQYTLTRKYTGLLFVTATGVIMLAGEEEDKEDVRKKALNPKFWERQLYKMKQMFKEQKDNIYRDLTGAALSVSLDPQTSYGIKMAGGFALFNLWKEDAVAKLAEKGLTKKEIEERKRKIKEVESVNVVVKQHQNRYKI